MFWKNRIKKLNKKDYLEYINNYEKLDLGISMYNNIIVLFLVNIIFMLAIYVNYTMLSGVLESQFLLLIVLWQVLIKIQIFLVIIDIVFSIYNTVKYFLDVNRFLKRCGV